MSMLKLLIIFGFFLLIGGIVFVIVMATRKENKDLVLTYKISAGIPFRWDVDIEDKSVIAYLSSYVARNENVGGIVGAPIYTNYVFRGLRPGATKIIFKFVNFTNNEVSKTETYHVLVDNDLRITITNIDR